MSIKFTILPAVGAGGIHKHGTVKDLLFEIPYLFMPNRKNLIPPLFILNDLLKKGVSDAGMSGGCRWKPFAVAETEYDELVEELLTEPNYKFYSVETPKDIKNFDDWFLWTISRMKNNERTNS